MAATTPYPASVNIDYKEQLDRLTTFFRIFTVIPIAIILGLLTNATFGAAGTDGGVRYQYATAGFVFLPLVLMLLFRRKYPRWWFDWNMALLAFSTRVSAYLLLLRDEYPSTDEEQAVHITVPYPNAETDLNRWLPLVKWFLAIPHYIVLFFLSIAGIVVLIISWFAILITGNYPRAFFDFIVGLIRWSIRVQLYAVLLTTDRYPPFSLSE